MHDLSYNERLKALKLYSLQRRRERYCIIYVWKVLEGLVPNVSHLANYCYSQIVEVDHVQFLAMSTVYQSTYEILLCVLLIALKPNWTAT